MANASLLLGLVQTASIIEIHQITLRAEKHFMSLVISEIHSNKYGTVQQGSLVTRKLRIQDPSGEVYRWD